MRHIIVPIGAVVLGLESRPKPPAQHCCSTLGTPASSAYALDTEHGWTAARRRFGRRSTLKAVAGQPPPMASPITSVVNAAACDFGTY